jgi:hypothetical protein
MIKEVVPLHDVTVRVEVEDRPSQVILQPQNLELSFEVTDNVVCFTIPQVGLYEIVEIS